MPKARPARSPGPTSQTFLPSPTDEDAVSALLGRRRSSQKSDPVARDLLLRFGGLAGLSRATLRELQAIPGVGPARAARIHAALVLGRRSMEVVRERPGPYRGARDVYRLLLPRVAGAEKEMFFSLLLDSKNRLLKEEVVSVGTLTASLVHPREVFRAAIREAAASIIVAHNHPSGVMRSSGLCGLRFPLRRD